MAQNLRENESFTIVRAPDSVAASDEDEEG
jgi:hypothetical protein